MKQDRFHFTGYLSCLPAECVQAAHSLALRRLRRCIANAVRHGSCLIIAVTFPGAAHELQED